MANLYLTEFDRFLRIKEAAYFRYADDMILLQNKKRSNSASVKIKEFSYHSSPLAKR